MASARIPLGHHSQIPVTSGIYVEDMIQATLTPAEARAVAAILLHFAAEAER